MNRKREFNILNYINETKDHYDIERARRSVCPIVCVHTRYRAQLPRIMLSILLNSESGKEQKVSELMAVKLLGVFHRGGFNVMLDKAQLREIILLGYFFWSLLHVFATCAAMCVGTKSSFNMSRRQPRTS